ncbi:MAG: serine/threonine-protein kinase PknK, partial [Candidatus Omnitrophica bacterium]|nr:serine/threonine-protein kinase PknK [Candidatus Omnitrophota bacterium]
MSIRLRQDQIINSEYKILKKLDESMFSVVYKAFDINRKMDIVLKFLKRDVTSSYIEDVIRFKKEIEAVSKLEHANIIKLYGTGEYNNTLYIVEELLEGEKLSGLLLQGKIFNINETLEIINQITEALNYIHQFKIIHKDLKPGNIMVQKKNNQYFVKILDFGIAHVIDLSEIKDVDKIVGTFGYMSPEATGIIKKIIDDRSDLYSLGIVFYRLLTGELPFKSKQVNKLLHEQVSSNVIPLTKINQEIPKVLENIVMKLINRDPDLRYQSSKALLYDLHRYENGERKFVIGERDQKIKLTYQTKLIGRDEEFNKIKYLLDNAKKDQGSICLIGGVPGIGKTRLVNAIREYVYEQGYENGGLFITGRCFNQQNKVPYQPFKDALNEYINKIERLDEEIKKKEVTRIKSVLGDLGEIILKFNPNMKKIIDETSYLSTLDPEKENQRFIIALTTFFNNMVKKGQSCILFMDDLQWADEGTLNLLEELIQNV